MSWYCQYAKPFARLFFHISVSKLRWKKTLGYRILSYINLVGLLMMESMVPFAQQFHESAVPINVFGKLFSMSSSQPIRSAAWYVPRYIPSEPTVMP